MVRDMRAYTAGPEQALSGVPRMRAYDGHAMGKIAVVLYALALVAVVVGVDVLFFRSSGSG